MAGRAAWRCCVTGAADLTIQCAEAVVRQGGCVAAVVSSHAGVRNWAERQGILVFTTCDQAIAAGVDVDYLFSVVNPVLLSLAVLAWPTRAAINYHDAPLPRYAGVHATSWAILHGETAHGITWHLMTERPDAGDVLRQVNVDVRPQDTAFDLNIRCHEAALAGFEDLLGELSAGRLEPRPQDLAHRTYFSASAGPPGAGAICWADAAERIDRVLRACTLGPLVENRFGLAKIVLDGDFVVPAGVERLNRPSVRPPGTVATDDTGALVLSTATDDIRITHVTTSAGSDHTAPELLGPLGLHVGQQLPVLSASEAERLSTTVASIRRHESFCLEAMCVAESLECPVRISSPLLQPTRYAVSVSTTVDQLRLAVLVWLSRWAIRGGALWYSTDAMQARAVDCGPLVRAGLPLAADAVLSATVREWDVVLRERVGRIERGGLWAADLPMRCKGVDVTSWPVAIHVGDRPPATGAALLSIRIADGGASLCLASTPTRQSPAYAVKDLIAIAGHLRQTLAEVTARPDTPIGDLDLMPPDEHERWLNTDATVTPPPEGTVPERFERQARQAPDATALVWDRGAMTYRELDTRADTLAARLVDLGVEPGDLVGVNATRSPEMVIAILAVLKAGGAYVPLAADSPPERRRQLIADAGLRHIVTFADDHGVFGGATEHVLTVQLAGPMTRAFAQPSLRAHDAAYVNYTSGSTGRPKGVLVPHAGIVRLVCGQAELRPDRTACVLQAATLSFDAATLEIWGALLNGATLALLPDSPATPRDVATAIGKHRVDTLFLTTALFNQIVEHELPALAGLRHLMTGGEAMSPIHAERFLAAHPHCRLTNAYGPTENTSISTVHAVRRGVDTTGPVPIGRPIVYTRAYVLDAARRPLPAGVAGELYVAGAGLAIGYLNRPDLTAEAFVADPFVPGERMYRTGDLAYRGADGLLHFVGRIDRQIKIRGMRIEPGEIEAAVLARPDVAGCAVVPREDGPNGVWLVAYVVPRGAIDLSDVERFVTERLPAHLVPGAWMTMPQLPVTATGKLDTRALPRPQRKPAGGAAGRSDIEVSLCRLLAETLGLDAVGRDDNFFAIGGHSLLAAQFLGRVREAHEFDVPLRTLFAHPTIAGLVAQLPIGQSTQRPPLRRMTRPASVPLSATQRRLWFLQQLNGPNATYNICVAHRLDGALRVEALRDALGDVVARHESLRTIYPARSGVPEQRVLPPDAARPALAVEDCAADDVVARLIDLADEPFDVTRQSPLRATLLALSPTRHVLLIVLHHIAGDGWSLRPLWADLARAYAARRTGKAPAFAELPLQYADYTLWQHDAHGDVHDPNSRAATGVAFWTNTLTGLPAQCTIRPDRPRPAQPRHRGASVPLQIDAEVHRALTLLAKELNASLFMVLQAGLSALLAGEGCGTDIVLGTPVAGRYEPALEHQIGFYANTVALRTDVSGDPTFRDLIGRARAFTLDALANQDVPFDNIVQAISSSRSLEIHPVFQVMLALQNAPSATPVLAGVSVAPHPLASRAAKTDLFFECVERPGTDGQLLGLDGCINYDVDLYDAETMAALAGKFERLLRAAVARPDVSLSRLRLDAPSSPPMTLPALLSTAADAHRHAIALRANGQTALTHGCLQARLAELAGQLRALGIGRGVRVAIVMPNGPAMALSFLAVTSVATAAPLNPTYRKGEFDFFLSDSAATAVIVSDSERGPVVAAAQARGMAIIRAVSDGDSIRYLCDTRSPTPASAELLQPDDVALFLHTSGTTARPKLVPLSHANLCVSARNIAATLRLTPDDLCLNVMPLFHIHGLVAALLASLSAGAAVVCTEGFDATKMIGWLCDFRPTWYTAVPTMHAAILARAEADPRARPLAPLRFIRSSSAALPPTVAEGLERVFGVPVVEAYGMTEAAHQMCSNPLPPAVRKAGSVGLPAGPEVAVLDAAGRMLQRGESGEVAIRGANVTAGYTANDKANAESFTSDGWFRTGDLGHVDADGYLFLSGRSKEIINRGGEKISPRVIDEILLQHPAIAAAIAFAMPDAKLGEEVAAAVVLRRGEALTARDLMAFAAERLADFKVPRRIVFLDELPKGATGKVQRVGLAKTLGLAAATQTASASAGPASDTERHLITIWTEVLGHRVEGTNVSFFDLGGDSVLAVQVIGRVRAAGLGELPIYAFFDTPTVAGLATSLVPPREVDHTDLERLLAEIEAMTDQEAEARLTDEAGAAGMLGG